MWLVSSFIILKYKWLFLDGMIIDEKIRMILDFGVELIFVEKFNSFSEGFGSVVNGLRKILLEWVVKFVLIIKYMLICFFDIYRFLLKVKFYLE